MGARTDGGRLPPDRETIDPGDDFRALLKMIKEKWEDVHGSGSFFYRFKPEMATPPPWDKAGPLHESTYYRWLKGSRCVPGRLKPLCMALGCTAIELGIPHDRAGTVDAAPASPADCAEDRFGGDMKRRWKEKPRAPDWSAYLAENLAAIRSRRDAGALADPPVGEEEADEGAADAPGGKDPAGDDAGAAGPEPNSSLREVTAICCELRWADGPRGSLPVAMRDLGSAVLAAVCGGMKPRYGAELIARPGPWSCELVVGHDRASEYEAKRAVDAALMIVDEFAFAATSDERLHGRGLSVAAAVDRGRARPSVDDAGRTTWSLAPEGSPAREILRSTLGGAVLVGEEIARQVGPFFRLVSAAMAGGGRAFAASNPGGAETVFEAEVRQNRLMTLVGSEAARHVELLRSRWDRTREQAGRVVLLVGADGVGKSRIVFEFERGLGPNSKFFVLRMPCYERDRYTARGPLKRLIRDRLRLPQRPAAPEAERAIIRQVFEYHALDLAKLPAMEALLAHEAEGEAGEEKGLAADGVGVAVDLMLALSRLRPLVLIVEDLHLADEPTREFVRRLGTRARDGRMLTLVTARTPRDASWAPPALEVLRIEPLTEDEGRELATAAARGRRIERRVVGEVVDASRRIPRLILTRMEHWRIDGRADLRAGTEVHYRAMLDDLGEPAREVATWAAVIGQRFELDVLAAAMGRELEGLRRPLDELEARVFVFPSTRTGLTDYEFRDHLMRSEFDRSIAPEDRRGRERRVADALGRLRPALRSLQPERLARHLERSGAGTEAIPLRDRAGTVALARSAPAEAIVHFRRALHWLGRPAEAEGKRRRFGLLMKLGSALMAKGYASRRLEQTFLAARELAADPDLGDPAALFKVERVLWVVYLLRGDRTRALELGDSCRGSVVSTDDPGYRAESHLIRGYNAFYFGALAQAAAELEQAVAPSGGDVRRYEYHRRYQQDPWMLCHSRLAHVYFLMGREADAVAANEQAMARARWLEDPFNLAIAQVFSAWLRQFQGDPRGVLADTDEAIKIAGTKGFTHWGIQASILHGWAEARGGAAAAGRARIEEGLAIWGRIGTRLITPYFLTLLAEAQWLGGAGIDEIISTLDRAAELVAMTGEHVWSPIIGQARRLFGGRGIPQPNP